MPRAELLPVPYFHVVFTLPAALGAIAYQNKDKVYAHQARMDVEHAAGGGSRRVLAQAV